MRVCVYYTPMGVLNFCTMTVCVVRQRDLFVLIRRSGDDCVRAAHCEDDDDDAVAENR